MPKTTPDSTGEPDEELSFEAQLERLQAISEELEDGRLPLREAVTQYEEAVRLIASCEGYLKGAEQRIEQLVAVDEAGNEETVPFDAESSAQKQRRTVKRSKRRATSEGDDPESPELF